MGNTLFSSGLKGTTVIDFYLITEYSTFTKYVLNKLDQII